MENLQTLLSNLSKDVGSPVKIGSFLRMEVGEGLQGAANVVPSGPALSYNSFLRSLTPHNSESINRLFLHSPVAADMQVFDGNRPRLARSIAGWSVRDGEITRAIQASPSGGCCAAHGSIVHVYDCMLEQCCAINLDYNEVNNLCWIDSENIVVSTDGKLGSGGMGLFNASTGELRYKFQVTDKLKGYTSGALGFSPDNKLFSSCTGPGDQHGIDFLDGSPYRSQNNASSCSGYMECCYPKLAFHEGQFFSSMNDTISVHCGSDWVPTSQFQQSRGGPIWGFSIGGARLFALHRNEYVLDVWDAPRSPVN
ncbi:BTB/POZ domain-containing protein [Capsicum annuum]|nr:BTB/POZ domain-containing protein [Capsicum annuum]